MPEEETEDTPESEPEHPEPGDESYFAGSLSDQELDRLLEQYIHYAEVAVDTSNQRIQTNRTFGIILTTLLAGLFGLGQGNLSINLVSSILFASLIGAITCHYWYGSIQSYRRLNNARYTILNEIEDALPAPLYTDEWKYLKKKKPDPDMISPRGADDQDHQSHTIVERRYIRLLQIGYFVIGSYSLVFIPIEGISGIVEDLPLVLTKFIWKISEFLPQTEHLSLVLTPFVTIVMWETYRQVDTTEGWSLWNSLRR